MSGAIKHYNYKFSQSFGAQQEDAQTAPDDLITDVQFSQSGRELAVGDAAGRVILFGRKESAVPQFAPTCEFVAHHREFDISRSQEIQPEIIGLQFLPPTSCGIQLLTASERDVRLFQIGEKGVYFTQHSEKFPKKVQSKIVATPRRLYSNASSYHLNSLSLSPHGDSFLVADDFSVSQFWVEDHTVGFQVITNAVHSLDAKLNLITVAKYHPQDGNLIFTGYSSGQLRLYDLRQNLRQTSIAVPAPGDVHDIVVNSPNLVFCRTSQFMSVFDIRNMHKALLQVNMNPKIQAQASTHSGPVFSQIETYAPSLNKTEHEVRFNLGISKDQQFWASGFYGNQLYVGNLQNDVLGFKATRILKKAKDKELPGAQVGARLCIQKGQVNLGAYTDSRQGNVEKVAFGPDCLVAAGGGNLFVYSW